MRLEISLMHDLRALTAFHLNALSAAFLDVFFHAADRSISFNETLGARVSLPDVDGRQMALSMNGRFESYALAAFVRTRQRLIETHYPRSFASRRQHRFSISYSPFRFPKHLVQDLDVLVQIVEIPECLLTVDAFVTLDIVVDEGSVQLEMFGSDEPETALVARMSWRAAQVLVFR